MSKTTTIIVVGKVGKMKKIIIILLVLIAGIFCAQKACGQSCLYQAYMIENGIATELPLQDWYGPFNQNQMLACHMWIDDYGTLVFPASRSTPLVFDVIYGDGNWQEMLNNGYRNHMHRFEPNTWWGTTRRREQYLIVQPTSIGEEEYTYSLHWPYTVEFHGFPENANFNYDGVVDAFDLLAWQDGYLWEYAGHPEGDADYSRHVDAFDLLIWQDYYESGPTKCVPEPTMRSLVFLAAVCIMLGIAVHGFRKLG